MADIFLGTEVEPSAFEIALQEIFLSGLQKRVAETGDLSSALLTTLGFKRDNAGNLVSLSEQERFDSLDPSEQSTFNVLKTQSKRLETALAGELPVSERLKQRSSDQFAVLNEELSRRGQGLSGTNLENAVGFSTPGIQSLGERQRTQGLLVNEEQRAEINSGTANVLNSAGLLSQLGNRRFTDLSNAPQRFDVGGGGGLLANTAAATRLNQETQTSSDTNLFSLGAAILGRVL